MQLHECFQWIPCVHYVNVCGDIVKESHSIHLVDEQIKPG